MMTKGPHSKAGGKRAHLSEAFTAFLIAGGALAPAQALPIAGSVSGQTSGAVNITETTNSVTVDSTAERAIIDWFAFTVTPTESVTFNQPTTSSIIVNRIGSANSGPFTVIDGPLTATGNVWFIDPRGVTFGPNAVVDVFGLLATPAGLNEDDEFIAGGVSDPIRLLMPEFPGAVVVNNGARIISRGGPLMFVGGLSTNPGQGGVFSDGLVYGTEEGNTPEQMSASQILYGLAGNFTLTFGQPNAMTSPDIQLFNFVIDTPAPRSYDTNTGGLALDAIALGGTSGSFAGEVYIAGEAEAPDPARAGLNSLQYLVSGPVGAVFGNVVISGDGGISVGNGVPDPDAAQIDVVFDRKAFTRTNQGAPFVSLDPLITVEAAGSTQIYGRNVTAIQRRLSIDNGENGVLAVPDHTTVQFTQGVNTNGGLQIVADGNVTLDNALFINTDGDGVLLTAGGNVEIENSIGDLALRNDVDGNGDGVVQSGIITAGGAVVVREVASPSGEFSAAGTNILLNDILAAGPITVDTRSVAVTGGANAAGNVLIRGGLDARPGYVVSRLGSVTVESSAGNVSIGSIQTSFPPPGVPPNQRVSVVAAGDVILSGANRTDVGGQIIGDDVTVTAVNQIFLSDLVSANSSATLTVTGPPTPFGALTRLVASGVTATNGAITLTGPGSFLTGALDAGTSVFVSAVSGLTDPSLAVISGSVSTNGGAVQARNGNVTFTAPGTVTTGAVTATGAINLTSSADALTAGALSAGGVINAIGQTGVSVASALGTIVNLNATTGLTSVGIAGTVFTPGAVTSTAGGATVRGRDGVTVGEVNAAGPAILDAANGAIATGNVTAAQSITATAGGAVTAGALRAGTFVDVTAGGALNALDVTATSERARLVGAGNVAIANVVAGREIDIRSTAGQALTGNLTAGQSVTAQAQNRVATGNIDAGTSITLGSTTNSVRTGNQQARNGGVTIAAVLDVGSGNVTATGGISANSSADFVIGGVYNAGGALTATGQAGVRVQAASGASVGLNSSAGAVQVGTPGTVFTPGDVVARTGDASLIGRDGVTAGAVSATGGAITLTSANGATSAGALTAGGTVNGRGQTGFTSGAIDAGVGIDVVSNAGQLSTGNLTARNGAVVGVGAQGVKAGVVSASNAITMTSAAGAVATQGLTAGAGVTVGGQTGVTIVGNTRGAAVTIESQAGGLAFVDPVAPSAPIGTITATNGDVTVSAAKSFTLGAVAAPGAITVGATAGDVTLASATGQRLRVTAASNAAGAGNVRLTGPVSISGGAVPTTPAVQIEATGNISVEAPLTSQYDAFFAAGGTFTNTAPIRVTESVGVTTTAAPQPTFGGLDIRAQDVAIGDLLFARGARGVSIGVVGTGGAFLGDGAGRAGALTISGAELARIDAPSFALRAGLGPNGGGPLIIGDTTIDRTRIGRLVLATGSGGTLRVVGTVGGVGAPDLTLGDGAVQPAGIEITGSLGTLAQPFGQTALISAGDILIGTQAFVDLVNSAPNKNTFDVNSVDPGFGGATAGQLFFVAGGAVFSAPGVILQQNTGRGGDNAGVRFGVPNPNAFPGAFGAFAAPQRIELFGQVIGLNGQVLSDDEAALASNLLAPGLPPNESFLINNCVIGSAGACASDTTTTFDPVQLIGGVPGPSAGGGQGQQGRNGGAPDRPSPRRMAEGATKFEVDPSDQDLSMSAEARDERDPGVGAANEDLWPAER